jgi:hypothetical protein
VGGPAVAEGRKIRTEKFGGCFIIIIINSGSRLINVTIAYLYSKCTDCRINANIGSISDLEVLRS